MTARTVPPRLRTALVTARWLGPLGPRHSPPTTVACRPTPSTSVAARGDAVSAPLPRGIPRRPAAGRRFRAVWGLVRAVRPAAGGLVLAVLAGVGAAGAGVGLMATSAWLISRAAQHPPVLHLMVAIVAVRAFGIGRGVLRYVERLTGHDAAFRLLGALRVRAYRRLERLAPAGLTGFRRGDLVARLVDDVESVLDLVVRVVLPIVVAAVTALGTVLLVGAMLPAAAVALAGALLVAGVGVPLLQSAVTRRADARLAPLHGALAAGTVDLVQGLPDLIANGAAPAALARLAETDRALLTATRRASATTGVSAAVTALCTGLAVLSGLAAGALAVRAGTLPGELLAVVVLTPLALFETVGAVPPAAQRLAAARAALSRLTALSKVPDPAPDPAIDPAIDPAVDPVTSSSVLGRDVPTLRMEGVDAGWPGGPAVLHGVSLDLPAGRRVALVGPSGAGKSTIAALLVRWLDPRAGRVTLGGTDLRELCGDDVRRVVGCLDDSAYLFDTTIEANLRVARPGASAAELDAVLEQARLLDWVRTLPAGLATPVGEHGLALSGGQRRRLALARLLLAGFPIVVLDEPTEHLDEPTAAALTEDLLAATHGRTVLLITHRAVDPSSVDEILHLDAGVLAAEPRAAEPASAGRWAASAAAG
ncbi:thiol reductant ABC exporter subunit CydC [Dactylosporangium sp. AC04546]|uniref:thiol reductant ABC exporter subunit CydC n=1 Tax=Dactylosporangium sp. AC04546 TaxID=2862460 RepID=UPI002E7C5629|nr:thiol reductant ABC exporter subunit CydC [Dactylosporangium sp. AC04546]WVK80149.1 thiol reductant ABC exporter subunit CydC [Dactylosporangium sp. AC04546]